MALTITSGYTVSAGEVWTPTKHNLSTVPSIQQATSTITGRTTAGPGSIEELTATQARAILGLAATDTPTFAGVALTNGLNSTAVGNSTPSTGAFTTLSAKGLTVVDPAAAVTLGIGSFDGLAARNNTLRIDTAGPSNKAKLAFSAGGTEISGIQYRTDGAELEFLTGGTARAALTAASFSITPATASTSTTTGCGIFAGGVGIAGAAWIGATCNANAFNTTSARRFKKNIRTLLGSEALLKLRPVWYDDKRANGRKRLVGFIAEEVKKVLPSMVANDSTGRATGVNYSQLVALCVASAQDQEKRLRKLERAA